MECQPWLLIVTGVMHEQTTLTQSATPGSVISNEGFDMLGNVLLLVSDIMLSMRSFFTVSVR